MRLLQLRLRGHSVGGKRARARRHCRCFRPVHLNVPLVFILYTHAASRRNIGMKFFFAIGQTDVWHGAKELLTWVKWPSDPSQTIARPGSKLWRYEESCGTHPVSAVKLRGLQKSSAQTLAHPSGSASPNLLSVSLRCISAPPDGLCARSQRTICTKLPLATVDTAASRR